MTKDFASEALRSALGKTPGKRMHALFIAVATAVFFAFAYHARYATLDNLSSFRLGEMTLMTGVMFTIVYAVSMLAQAGQTRKQTLGMQVLFAVITGAVLLGKISLLDYVSDDYSIFLNDWIATYTQMGIKEGLGAYIGSDYTPPYLYLMLIISRFPDYPWLYMVKFFSLLADVLLSFAIMKLVSLKKRDGAVPLLFFHIASLLPTVVFNGAYWGQCDAIYASFCLTAMYLSMDKKPVRGMIAFGVALSFKLQTVFFLPVLLPLWLRREVKLRHLLCIPAAYMVMMIPALWGGKSMHHVLTCYLQQAGQYNFMTVNAPSLYQLLPLVEIDGHVLYNMFSPMAMALGIAALAACCLPVCMQRKNLTHESAMLFALLVMSAVPFFLPKMHERYTFGADVLSLAVCVYAPRRVALPLLFGLASYICYTAGLPGDSIMALKWASMFQLAGVVLTACELMRALRGGSEMLPEVKA